MLNYLLDAGLASAAETPKQDEALLHLVQQMEDKEWSCRRSKDKPQSPIQEKNPVL